MKKSLVLCSLGLLLLGPSSATVKAQENQSNTIDVQKLDKHFQEASKAVNAPSVSVAIFDEDETIFAKSYGQGGGADISYAIGSLTKSLTAVGVMRLVEEGKVDLNAKLSTYVKGLDYGDKVTVKQLLNQDSGMPAMTEYGEVTLGKQGQFLYSNNNYTLLGQLIEKVSGQSYPDFMEEEVFAPLGMTKTTADIDQSIKDGVLDGHRNYFGFNGPLPFKEEHPETGSAIIKKYSGAGTPDQQAAAGYVTSSASDMAKYLQLYLKDGAGLLNPTNTKAMYEDTVSLETNPMFAKLYPDHHYGYGWMSSTVEGQRLIWHNGGTSAILSYAFFLPDKKIGGVILMNKLDRLSASGLWHQNMLSVASYLAGGKLTPLPSKSYWTTHLMVDVAYLAVLLIPLISLLRLRQFRQQLALGQAKFRRWTLFVLLHLLFPALIWFAPPLLLGGGMPRDFFSLAFPDTWLVMLLVIATSILTGLIKACLWWRYGRALSLSETEMDE